MREATPEAHKEVKSLSPQARKLLAQLSNSGDSLGSAIDASLDVGIDAPADMPEMLSTSVPVLLTPHGDSKADAFADLLGHIDDGSDAMMIDEKAALAVAEKYRNEKQAATIAFDDDDLLDEFAGGNDDASRAFDTVMDEALVPLTDTEIDAVLGDDPFGENELDEARKRSRFSGLISRFRTGAGGVKQLIGVRNAAAAYDAQSGASLLPYTIIRAIFLVLVAAVPPAVNLAIIQPQISDNSRKLTQIRSFEAQMAENKKIADKLATQLSALEQDAKRRIDKLMPNEDLERLFNSYVSALQKYDIELRGYNVSALSERKVIIGNRVQEASFVELDLAGRYEVYVDIRKIFVDQLKIASVVKETMVSQEDNVNLLIKASLMVPTKREYDAELDDPNRQAVEAKP